MIKSIVITNHVGDERKMYLRMPEGSGFLITSIDGLGPAKASINTTTIASDDGSTFTSGRLDNRNIVMKLRFIGQCASDIEKLRLESYKFFSIKKRLKFKIETDFRDCYTFGYVESNIPDIFSPESGCQISIMCPNPYFYSTKEMHTKFSGVYPNFEFPFENQGLEPALELGYLYLNRDQNIYYTGDADVGCTIVVECRGFVENLKVVNKTTGETMTINDDKLEAITGSKLIDGDKLTINTLKGDKTITLLRNGETYNVMNALERRSKWIQLIRGDNHFSYSVSRGADSLNFSIYNSVLYEGV